MFVYNPTSPQFDPMLQQIGGDVSKIRPCSLSTTPVLLPTISRHMFGKKGRGIPHGRMHSSHVET